MQLKPLRVLALATALFLHLFTAAQTRVITEKVQDDRGFPLPGASVMKEINTTNERHVDISMLPVTNSLNEVVVTAKETS